MSTNNMYAPITAPAAMHNVMVTNHPIRYHTTEARRLLEVTSEGLSSNGILIDQFDTKKNGKYLLCGGLRLTEHAAEQLHQSMGGRGDATLEHMDLKTVTFMQRANLASPAGYKGAPPVASRSRGGRAMRAICKARSWWV